MEQENKRLKDSEDTPTSSRPRLSISVTHSTSSGGTLGWVDGAKASNEFCRGKKTISDVYIVTIGFEYVFCCAGASQ